MGINNIEYNGAMLTQKQYDIVMFMKEYLAENDNMPTRVKVADFLGISGVFSAQRHVVTLINKGILEYLEDGSGRIRFSRDP